MDGQTSGTNEALENQTPVDPWIAAFAALEPKGEEASAADADSSGQSDVGAGDPNAQRVDGQDALDAQGGNSSADEDAAGGLDTPAGTDSEEGGEGAGGAFDIEVTEDDIQKYEEDLYAELRDQAIGEVAQEFIKHGVRNQNGRLGATFDDPDICKRDSDGVPHFYNPETGQEFHGDNPRRQAQEWVDDYNRELARAFNNACEEYEKHLRQEAEPKLAVMKFKPKYDKLDDIRKGMFDNIVEDYEVKDPNGDVIGYSCDLDKALALVERQISMIQSYAKTHAPQQEEQAQQPTGPALDMKTSSGAVNSGESAPINSLEAAMERLQNEQLERLRK